MTVFEYPYVTVTILIIIFIALITLGLHFTIKSVKTEDETSEKDFCGIRKIENEFEKSGEYGKKRSIIHISISLESMKRLYSEAKAAEVYDKIKRTLFEYLCVGINGDISICSNGNFIALNDLKPEEMQRCIEQCFKEIGETLTEYGAVNIIRVHFGYVYTSSNEVPFKTALCRAKKALSMAESKNFLYCQWNSSGEKAFEKKIKIENSIQNEIDNNKFFLEYQPILEAKTEKIVGAEVLARLNSSTEGILTPKHFLSAVNNVGLNKKFDYYIFEKNCKWISNDKENRVKYLYTINFSRYTLCDKNMAENIINIIKEYGIDCSCMAIEVLEDKSLNAEERAEVIKNLNRLAKEGILILLDDFGKGCTGFDDLKDFNINIVKIDKSITQNAANQKEFLILKNIIRTAHELGLKALCEGIETEEQKKAAADAGCDMFQGYYFYPPASVMQLEKLLKK